MDIVDMVMDKQFDLGVHKVTYGAHGGPMGDISFLLFSINI